MDNFALHGDDLSLSARFVGGRSSPRRLDTKPRWLLRYLCYHLYPGHPANWHTGRLVPPGLVPAVCWSLRFARHVWVDPSTTRLRSFLRLVSAHHRSGLVTRCPAFSSQSRFELDQIQLKTVGEVQVIATVRRKRTRATAKKIQPSAVTIAKLRQTIPIPAPR